MKRESLITKLVAFMLCVMMVVGCLPVSAFAAENDWEGELDVQPGYEESNPLQVVFEWNDEGTRATASVSVPEGLTMYFSSYDVSAGLEFTANGVAVANVSYGSMMMRQPSTWSLTSGEYELVLAVPVGAYANPAALVLGYNDVSLEENSQGYYYTWTAQAEGNLTFEISSITEGVEADIVINNNTSYANRTLAADGVEDDFGVIVVTMPVAAGDEVSIQVVVMPDDSYSYPAADITHYSAFTYPLGSEQNPIMLLEQHNGVLLGTKRISKCAVVGDVGSRIAVAIIRHYNNLNADFIASGNRHSYNNYAKVILNAISC